MRSFIHHHHRLRPTMHVQPRQFLQRLVVQLVVLGHRQRGCVARANPAGAVALQEQPVARAHALGAHGVECTEEYPCMVNRLPRV